MPGRTVRLATALAATAAALPAQQAAAAVVFETYSVPTVGGATINVEVTRDAAKKKAPVILTYSPYNSLRDPAMPGENIASDAVADRYVDKGYARAVADVIGTRNSTGCWDYGGAKEQQSGVDVVKFLAKQKWSNKRVGMIGGSYNGTTATMVAARGDDVPELEAIVPVAAISRWYGYAYGNGVRYNLNSDRPTDEGVDTPLLFDFGFGRTPPTRPDNAAAVVRDRIRACDADLHTEKGYDTSPDYDEFWRDRDYRKDADSFRAAVLIAHGWQDYNVKQEEAVGLFEALPVDDPKTKRTEGVPLKRMVLTQARHSSPSGEAWQALLDDFWGRYLMGEDTDIEDTPLVTTTTRVFDKDTGAPSAGPTFEETAWPPAGTTDKRLWIRRVFDQDVPGVTVPNPGTGETGTLSEEPNTEARNGVFSWVAGPTTEEFTNGDPLNEPGHGYYSLFFKSEPLAADTRIVGEPVLEGWFRGPAGAHVAPVLMDIAPNGTARTIARGFMNLDYREGLAQAKPAAGQWGKARFGLLPQDVIIPKCHRLGLMLQSGNTVWALPTGTPGLVSVLTGPRSGVSSEGSSLTLPVVPARPEESTSSECGQPGLA